MGANFSKAKKILIGGSILGAISPSAFASDAITTVVYNVCDWLSGVVAIAVGVLVVIWSGYEMLQGNINKGKLLVRCVAIGLIIGGSYYAKSILMKGI